MVASLRDVASTCLNKTGTVSVLQDILGVYGTDNPQNRSVLAQVNRIQTMPFVKIALVTVNGATPQIQRDLDVANTVWPTECDAWVYPTASITVNAPALLTLTQTDCFLNGHQVSTEEDQLFDFGRNLGANVVCYYINGDTAGNRGCAAHPPDRRGFWVGNGTQWTFAHELTHVIGSNIHVDDAANVACMLDTLMTGCGTANINVANPDITDDQCDRILGDPDMEEC